MGYFSRNHFLVASLSVIVFLAPAVPSLSPQREADSEEWKTKGWPNGRTWDRFEMQGKINYLSGMEIGLHLYDAELGLRDPACERQSKKLIDDLTIAGFRFSELAEQVNGFYMDRANVRIPIAYAYVYTIKKMSGVGPRDLEAYAAGLRKLWNQQ